MRMNINTAENPLLTLQQVILILRDIREQVEDRKPEVIVRVASLLIMAQDTIAAAEELKEQLNKAGTNTRIEL